MIFRNKSLETSYIFFENVLMKFHVLDSRRIVTFENIILIIQNFEIKNNLH